MTSPDDESSPSQNMFMCVKFTWPDALHIKTTIVLIFHVVLIFEVQ